MVCRLAYIPEETLVHVVGLAPTKDNQVRLIYSQVPLLLSHTCAHGIADFKCPRGDPALSQIGISIVKKLKERALSLPGKLPAPSILANFALRFGSGSPLPLINASFDGYLWTLPVFVRLRRQKYWSLTTSGLTNRLDTWRRTAAISSNVLCMSW